MTTIKATCPQQKRECADCICWPCALKTGYMWFDACTTCSNCIGQRRFTKSCGKVKSLERWGGK